MRKMINKFMKAKTKMAKGLDKQVLESPETQALQGLNLIMNILDGMNTLGFGEDDTEYVNTRAHAHVFMMSLVEKIEKKLEKTC